MSRPTVADDDLEQLLTATWQRLAEHDLAHLQADNPNARVRNRTAWLAQAAAERRTRHEPDARAHLASADKIPIPIDLAETLDPSCGPDDGGAERARRAAAETAARAQAEQDRCAAEAARTAQAEQRLQALPDHERSAIEAEAEATVPPGAPLRSRVVHARMLELAQARNGDR